MIDVESEVLIYRIKLPDKGGCYAFNVSNNFNHYDGDWFHWYYR